MAQDVNVTNMQPAGGGVNKPASGTYGEQAALDSLKAALPLTPSVPMDPAASLPPMPTAAPGTPPAPADGLPSALLAPTRRPDVPQTTPLDGAIRPPVPSMTERQRRLALLDSLANSPEVSDETREWASRTLRLAVQGGKS